LVQEEIQSGHFPSVDELIVQTVHAWRERFGAQPPTKASESRSHFGGVLRGKPSSKERSNRLAVRHIREIAENAVKLPPGETVVGLIRQIREGRLE
jgi:hypothetical protein